MDGLTAGRLGSAFASGLRGNGPVDDLEVAYHEVIRQTLGTDPHDGTLETPARAAKAWRELTAGYGVNIAALFKTFDAEGYDEMIAVTGVPFSSLCEHHLLPFSGLAHVVYLPTDKIVGLSKIPRVVHAYARRLQNQERLSAQIADALEEHLAPLGVMVRLEAEHSCMRLRGACSAGTMRTSVTRGLMRDDPKARGEALDLISG